MTAEVEVASGLTLQRGNEPNVDILTHSCCQVRRQHSFEWAINWQKVNYLGGINHENLAE